MVKKLTINILILSVTMLLVGCQMEKLSLETSQAAEGITEITARSGESKGKTCLDESGNFLWEPLDEISVFYNGDHVKFKSIISRPSELTVFRSEHRLIIGGTEGAGDYCFYGISPYSEDNAQIEDTLVLTVPALQKGIEYNVPLVGRSTNTEMAFYHVGGLLGFTLTQSGIHSVSIKSNAGEPIAGKVKVVFGQDGKPVISEVVAGVNTIRVVAESLEEGLPTGVPIYVSVLPQTLSQGITVAFQKSKEVAYRSSSVQREIRRCVVGNLGEIDYPSSTVKYNDKFVDLGLSVKWSTINLGADFPEEAGRYFAFGDLSGQLWGGSNWLGDGFNNECYYELDGDNNLTSSSDAAFVNLGQDWRMPTKDEYQELIDSCSFTWTTNYNETGVAGMIATSKVEGFTDKSIFFPGSGFGYGSSLFLNHLGLVGHYWSATHQGGICFDDQELSINTYHTKFGLPIRPVVNEIVPVDGLIGEYTASGDDYWEGASTWTMTIVRDTVDLRKVWIYNWANMGSRANSIGPIYGVVNPGVTSMTIPFGQVLGVKYKSQPIVCQGIDSDLKGYSRGYTTAKIIKDANGNVTKISFNKDYGFQCYGEAGAYFGIVCPETYKNVPFFATKN